MNITLNVNGQDYPVVISPEESLLTVLRDRLNLIGTKEGCGTGECGSCTVLADDRPLKSCLTWAVQMEGRKILTIEGMTRSGHPLHPVQKAYVEAGAVQCGFCTPGFVLATYGLLKKYPDPTDNQIKEELAGNICRCTGYETILAAVKLAAANMKEL